MFSSILFVHRFSNLTVGEDKFVINIGIDGKFRLIPYVCWSLNNSVEVMFWVPLVNVSVFNRVEWDCLRAPSKLNILKNVAFGLYVTPEVME